MNVETVKLKNDKKFRATVYVNGRRVRSPLFKRRIDAALWAERAEQGYVLHEIPTFSQACETWMECHCSLHNRPGTLVKNKEKKILG